MRPMLASLLLVVGFAPQIAGSGQDPQVLPAPVAQAPAGPRLELTFEGDGRVTLIANGATLREILQEWTRKGGTPFVGAERLSGGPLMLRYEKQSEVDVVQSLLRSASGVILAPRREGVPGASQFEAVYVVATSASTAAPAASYTPTYSPQSSSVSTPGRVDAEIPAASAGSAGPGPQPGADASQAQPPASTGSPRAVTVSPVAVQVVPVGPTTNAPPPTSAPPPTNTGTGRGGGGGGGGGGR